MHFISAFLYLCRKSDIIEAIETILRMCGDNMKVRNELNYQLFLQKTSGIHRQPMNEELEQYDDICNGDMEAVRQNADNLTEFLSRKLSDNPVRNVQYHLTIMASAIGAILGHNFPIYYGFKGGKGVATSLGVLLVIEWKIGLVCLIFALVLMIASRMVSLGSITAAILYPVLVFVLPGTAFNNNWLYLTFSIILALLVIIRHRANIKRLLSGTENKLWETKAEKKAKLK